MARRAAPAAAATRTSSSCLVSAIHALGSPSTTSCATNTSATAGRRWRCFCSHPTRSNPCPAAAAAAAAA
eukprot:CAMPEP_0197600270 /NCGR_PEP_ID=MMETSP1326-20131121/32957_1 /TAXON_ID=1155430 /ORGANISM="Genus nov. species nov., Strain RCC2288" /LENGTH=69 /DNA_ID=CAMNT_0043167355 /DNA_START=45 /DNA_END=251 /DNA_ORIENTATION=+